MIHDSLDLVAYWTDSRNKISEKLKYWTCYSFTRSEWRVCRWKIYSRMEIAAHLMMMKPTALMVRGMLSNWIDQPPTLLQNEGILWEGQKSWNLVVQRSWMLIRMECSWGWLDRASKMWGSSTCRDALPPQIRISLSRQDLFGEERWPISQRRRARSLFLNGLYWVPFAQEYR